MRSVTYQNKKVSARAVRLIASCHRNDPANVLKVARLVGKMMRHAFGQLRAPLLAGGKISALDHEAFDHPTERGRVERARSRQIEKTSHRFRRGFGQHL